METLKQGTRPTDALLKKITCVLCDCLHDLYGCRPSNYYKNQIALSLVKSYPILAAVGSDVPQALWFHAHARGINRHAGRIYYRMEYLARKSADRISKRRRIEELSPPNQSENVSINNDNVPNEDFIAKTDELKYIKPNNHSKTRILELWKKTLTHRLSILNKGTKQYVNDFPVVFAFNGLLISLDLYQLYPSAMNFVEKWDQLEPKILLKYLEEFRDLKNDFLRALAIVRIKNPSRGSKKTKMLILEKTLSMESLNGKRLQMSHPKYFKFHSS
ncbi:uncharacterized protein LOC129731889 [Wyeomyia smithii]|uniref:uncharacterized protein LOC129731889 n=1 Tax=Wyeomyia smithii TaxID=174621 RepID=UPI002467B858|nr:uncharacterized protein LOC129731889 [Wyeomyia smithii]